MFRKSNMRAVLGEPSTVDSEFFFFFLLWLHAQLVHICLVMFVVGDPANYLFLIPSCVMLSDTSELVVVTKSMTSVRLTVIQQSSKN